MSMPIQRQSEQFSVFDTGTRWERDRPQHDLPKGLAGLVNSMGPRITGGMLNTRTAGVEEFLADDDDQEDEDEDYSDLPAGLRELIGPPYEEDRRHHAGWFEEDPDLPPRLREVGLVPGGGVPHHEELAELDRERHEREFPHGDYTGDIYPSDDDHDGSYWPGKREAGWNYPEFDRTDIDDDYDYDLDKPDAAELADIERDMERDRARRLEEQNYLRHLDRNDPSRHIPGDYVDPREARLGSGRRPFDRAAAARLASDEKRQQSRDKAKELADGLWNAFFPPEEEEGRIAVQNMDTVNNFMNNGWQPEHIKYDEDGQPYAHYEHPSGWTVTDRGGMYKDIGHVATPDTAHDVINVSRHDPDSRQSYNAPFGPQDAHDYIENQLHGDPEETGGIFDYLGQNDPRIRRHRPRQARRLAKDGDKSSKCTCWEGYERVPGTEPCSEDSCRKESMRLAGAGIDDRDVRSGPLVDSPLYEQDPDDYFGRRPYKGAHCPDCGKPMPWVSGPTCRHGNLLVDAGFLNGRPDHSDVSWQETADGWEHPVTGCRVQPSDRFADEWEMLAPTTSKRRPYSIIDHHTDPHAMMARHDRATGYASKTAQMSYEETMKYIDDALRGGEPVTHDAIKDFDRWHQNQHPSSLEGASGADVFEMYHDYLGPERFDRVFGDGDHRDDFYDHLTQRFGHRHAAAPAQDPAAMAPQIPAGGGFQPAHRVGLPWRDSVIPGTVIGVDGPNVAVRWDDGQYSTEEPHNIQLL